jgi:hypothetical protein
MLCHNLLCYCVILCYCLACMDGKEVKESKKAGRNSFNQFVADGVGKGFTAILKQPIFYKIIDGNHILTATGELMKHGKIISDAAMVAKHSTMLTTVGSLVNQGAIQAVVSFGETYYYLQSGEMTKAGASIVSGAATIGAGLICGPACSMGASLALGLVKSYYFAESDASTTHYQHEALDSFQSKQVVPSTEDSFPQVEELPDIDSSAL